ncbi:hypothetical protein FA13DRAFT_1804400 [Coprinellus micaceus]|uniref:Uncharacterized protein n=1 Tax=Coprinellus micaceus TaxID=71717 RepID=A0A4Y7S780_COPMI|nr:hypothetical protein FA13DRAFT_1804400 [Coprinellus micaceus]
MLSSGRMQSIDEAEYLLDQIPPPSEGDDELAKKLRSPFAGTLNEPSSRS